MVTVTKHCFSSDVNRLTNYRQNVKSINVKRYLLCVRMCMLET